MYCNWSLSIFKRSGSRWARCPLQAGIQWPCERRFQTESAKLIAEGAQT